MRCMIGDGIASQDDPSRGWEKVASDFARLRSTTGCGVIERWSGSLPPGGTVLDIGCGTGMPVADTLIARGFRVYGIDPAPTLLSAFRHRFPSARTACETAESSRFFDRRFDGIVAIGLLFLLPEDVQRTVIARIGRALSPGGHFLFSAPHRPCRWHDTLTGRPSVSLGEARYRLLLGEVGLHVIGSYIDEGANDYFHAVATHA